MLQKLDGIGYQSSLLSGFPTIVHGFSSRGAGDMRQGTMNRKRFAHTLGFKKPPMFAHQSHGNAIPGDGLVSMTYPVAVTTADCVPVLLADPTSMVWSAVHAGWRGTLGGIAGNAVDEMMRMGADKRRICAAIGPHIGGCCYGVPEERAQAFIDRFGKDEKMAFFVDGKWHLDIGWSNYRQLVEAGVSPDHIDAPPTCTSCQNDEFFSYRKDSKETYGEMMAVIGLKT
ncbi:polyphenol oxidase family protein [Candidatus Gottesmanbacteria bacterium]|nr:polyphenol oxidase family protein [Candidatus Gottesmanbacteria bacterium]